MPGMCGVPILDSSDGRVIGFHVGGSVDAGSKSAQEGVGVLVSLEMVESMQQKISRFTISKWIYS